MGGTFSAGGASATSASTGGASMPGGGASVGGASAIGGTPSNSGGSPTGGLPGAGGSRATGGVTSTVTALTGGATAAGGSRATGGATATAGATATGGAATGGAATGGRATGGAATGGMATGGTSSDTTPPTVISVSPLNGTKGVPASATITLNFSEPMDKASVSSALTITGLVAGDLGLSWNSNATSLTISPISGLTYATGQAPGFAAKTYTITVGTGARDLVGNAMTAAFSSNFATLRRVKYDISPETIIVSDTYMNPSNSCVDPLSIGGWSGSVSGGDNIAYLVFDVSAIGSASAMYAVESAQLSGHQTSPTGNFYTISAVHVNKIQYDSMLYNIQSYPVIADVGILASSYVAVSTLETLPSFKPDFVSNGITKHMYTIAPVSAAWSSSGAGANFTCLGFLLTVTYVIQ